MCLVMQLVCLVWTAPVIPTLVMVCLFVVVVVAGVWGPVQAKVPKDHHLVPMMLMVCWL
jgi:hypothetical protein